MELCVITNIVYPKAANVTKVPKKPDFSPSTSKYHAKQMVCFS